MIYRLSRGQHGRPTNNTGIVHGGLAAALALVGALGIVGCTPQQHPAVVTPRPTVSALPPAHSLSSSTPDAAPLKFPPIVGQFINAVNASDKARAEDLLCPKVLGISEPNIDKVLAKKGKMIINPDPRFSDPEHVALNITYGDSTTSLGTIEFAPYRQDNSLCVSVFNVD